MSPNPDTRAFRWLDQQGYECKYLFRLDMYRVMLDGQLLGLLYSKELVEFAKSKGWVE